jgi:hypothetical protein
MKGMNSTQQQQQQQQQQTRRRRRRRNESLSSHHRHARSLSRLWLSHRYFGRVVHPRQQNIKLDIKGNKTNNEGNVTKTTTTTKKQTNHNTHKIKKKLGGRDHFVT